MLSRLAVVICLALFALPLAARAEMPGQPCEASKLGTTKRAQDDQSIIACLKTGLANPAYEWKSMLSSSGGGVTGGCLVRGTTGNLQFSGAWGKGCKNGYIVGSTKDGGPEDGYSCGESGDRFEVQGQGLTTFIMTGRYWQCAKD